MKIVNIEEMRRIEKGTDARGHTYAAMMDMAGHAVATAALNLLLRGPDKAAVVLVGPGNNGGDGLVAARYMQESGVQVTVYLWKRDIKGDENFQKLKRAGKRSGLSILWADNDDGFAHLREALQTADVLIDALLGTGANRPIEGKLAELLRVVKDEIAARRAFPSEPEPALGRPLQFPMADAFTLGMDMPHHDDDDDEFWDDDDDEDFGELDFGEDGEDEDDEDFDPGDLDLDDGMDFEDDDEEPGPPWPPLPVLAVDCPSGLNSDTGELDPTAVPAEMTITFAYPKWGQVEYPGAGACGVLGVADIGVPAELAVDIRVELVEPARVQELLPRRPGDANKGTFGKAMVVAGSRNYTGAALLSSQAAVRGGAGLVTLAVPAPLHSVLAMAAPEITWALLPDQDGTHSAQGVAPLVAALEGYSALLVGPGLTRQPGAEGFVDALFGPNGLSKEAWQGRVVADADCLNILSGLPGWPGRLPGGSVLTPHPGEMGRLTGLSPQEINTARIATARRYAAEWGHVVLLKGAFTVVASPEGRTAVLPFAVPALATAGSGDVLAGALVAMLAQGLPAFEAALCAGYVHGHAGLLVEREIGRAGIAATDILARLPKALRQIARG